jgi:hypothetical protein
VKHPDLLLATVLALSFAAPAFAGPQLIQNGTFADGSNADWTATQNANGDPDTVEVNPSSVYGLPEYNGNFYNMEVNANAIDTVEQVVTGLIVGQYYDLSWGYGNRGGGGAQAVDVSFGGQFLVEDSYDGSTNPDTWTANNFMIEATATTETLEFASLDEGGAPSYGNEISDVSLIPEPASMALLGLGLVSLALTRRMANPAAANQKKQAVLF